MTDSPHNARHDLIGYHLGLLDANEAARTAAALRASAEAQAELAGLERDLAPLSQWTVTGAGDDLIDRILARTANAPRLIPTPKNPQPALARGESAPRGDGPMVSLRELAGLAAAIALFVGVFTPAYNNSRAYAQRVACLDNFRTLGAANAAYAVAYSGVFFYAGATLAPWINNAGPAGIRPANARHVYLPLRLGFVREPKLFVCPGRTGDRPMPAEAVAKREDFSRPEHYSYSALLQDEAVHSERCSPVLPLMADCNPMFDPRCGNCGIGCRPAPVENSTSHGFGAGQNVLRADGAGMWTTTARVGPDRDDIYRLADVLEYTGYERPTSNTDTFLVP